MSDELPSTIVVQELPDGVRYRLPVWKNRLALLYGLVLLFLALPFTCAGVVGLAGLFLLIRRMHDALLPLLLVLVPAGLVLALAVFLLVFALTLLLGHVTLTLSRGRLCRTSWLGPIAVWSTSRPLDQVQRLAIISDGEQKITTLVAAATGKEPLALAWLHPYEDLWELAHALAGRIGDADPAGAPEVLAEWTNFSGERPNQPVRSRIRESESDGVRSFAIPPAGMSGGVLVFVPFSLIWCGITLAIGAYVVEAMLQGAPVHAAALVLIPLVLIGGILLLLTLHLARRRAEFLVGPESLTLRRFGLFGMSERRWSRAEIDGIGAVQEWRKHTTYSANTHATSTSYQLVTRLRIQAADGKSLDLEARYGMHNLTVPAEWEWLGTRLRELLDVPQPA